MSTRVRLKPHIRLMITIIGMVCAPIAVAIALAWIIRPFTSVNVGFITAAAAASHRAASIWASSFVMYVAAAVWNIGVASVIVRRFLSPRARMRVLHVTFLAAVAGFFVRIIYGSQVAPLSLVVKGGVPIYRITAVGTSVTAALLVLLVASCCALVNRWPRAEITVKNLRERMSYVQLSLYSSAALLVIGVVQIYFLNDWPSHVLGWTSVPMREGLRHIAYTSAVVSGALYSSVLLMLYAPVLATHDRWIAQAAEQALFSDPTTDLSKWRERQGLGRSALEAISQIGAVVGPWLAAIGLPKLLTGA